MQPQKSNFQRFAQIFFLSCIGIVIVGFLVMPKEEGTIEDNTLLETWSHGANNQNIAILIKDTTSFNSERAKEISEEICNGPCTNAYFYANMDAYQLHAYKRTTFDNSNTSIDIKKLVATENEWKNTDNHWKTVQDNLIATLSFGEFNPYPYKQ